MPAPSLTPTPIPPQRPRPAPPPSIYHRFDNCPCYDPSSYYPSVPADRVSRSIHGCNGIGC
jgi:hypothetical protein